MTDAYGTDATIRHVIQWAEQQDSIRAVLLTSTRARPRAVVDVFSDYDVILVVRDIHPFVEDKRWVQEFGDVLVSYWDAVHADPQYDIEKVGNVIQYADGLKIDFTVWPIALMRRIVEAPVLMDELDAGYAILLDKDGVTEGLQAPTYTAYIPKPPTNEAFQTAVEDFFSDVPYVAKCLWRNELLPMKWCLDYDMKHVYLRPMLEWWMECRHKWSVPTGSLGKGLKKQLPPEVWSQMEQCYAGAGIEENWDALFKTIDLYRQAATDVAAHLGYAYPHDMDQRVTAYAQKIQQEH